MNAGIGYDTVIGMALGAASVWYLWNWIESDNEPSIPVKKNRKFSAEELQDFSGVNGRLRYVSTPSGKVFDVSKDAEHFTGDQSLSTELDDIKYTQVGTVIMKRDFTKMELAEYNGTNGRPVYICAKGVVYDVDPDFYGPDSPYEILAGRDATRALALVSLEQADVDNTSIEGLSWGDLNTLEEWIAKFEMKYHVVGFLVDEAPKSFLNKQRQQVVLSEKIEISHDTRIFRFDLPESNMVSISRVPLIIFLRFVDIETWTTSR